MAKVITTVKATHAEDTAMIMVTAAAVTDMVKAAADTTDATNYVELYRQSKSRSCG